MSLSPDDFTFISDMLKQRSGLVVTQDKMYLLESRLLPIARTRGFSTLPELIALIRKNPPAELLVEVTEAMTTNESLFFRDTKPFDQLKKDVLPLLRPLAQPRGNLRIWSAASSTGQEPYSIAMTILEDAASAGLKHEIVATDLAQKVIDKAKTGIYSQFEVQRGLSIQMLMKYFAQQADTSWQLKDNVRKMVDFRLQNLLEDFSRLGKFDLIFCRNVLIYFDDDTKAKLMERMAQILYPGSILVLGSTESVIDRKGQYEPLGDLRGIYKLK